MKSVAGGVQITDVVFDFDGLKGKAGGTVSLGLPVAAALNVELDRLDLDAYMPQPSSVPFFRQRRQRRQRHRRPWPPTSASRQDRQARLSRRNPQRRRWRRGDPGQRAQAQQPAGRGSFGRKFGLKGR